MHAIFPSPMLPPGLSIPGWPEGLGALLPLLVVAQLLWAVLYAAVAEPRLRGSAGVRGLQFALVPWLTSGLLYLPLIGAGFFGLALGAGWLPILGEAVRCAIFGVSLGVLYRLVRLARQPRKHSGWRRGFRRRGEGPLAPAPSVASQRAGPGPDPPRARLTISSGRRTVILPLAPGACPQRVAVAHSAWSLLAAPGGERGA